MFFCDPPGDSSPASLKNYGTDTEELYYIFLHDQEPIHLDIHRELFDHVALCSKDITHINRRERRPDLRSGIIITSEYQSRFVDQVHSMYGWQPFYYFFHGWAALDWYRGYDRTFLMPDSDQRQITKSFISPNRIIGGRRDHRIMLMYHLLKAKIKNAWISFPRVCPEEQQDVVELSKKFGPEVQKIFEQANLPFCFPEETDHPMHSCWLSLFNENASSLAHVVTETVYDGQRHHLTEKTFKPICLRMPFVLVSTAGSLGYLRRYGFQTFDHIWDEDYDLEIDDATRLIKISRLLKDLDDQSPRELQKIYKAAVPVLDHNFQHFYGGRFEHILWQELIDMLSAVRRFINAN